MSGRRGGTSVLLGLAVAAAVGVCPAPALGQAPAPWPGRDALLKSRQSSLRIGTRTVATAETPRVYRAWAVDGEWVWLTAPGVRGWAPAADLIGPEQAVAEFTRQLRDRAGDAWLYSARSHAEANLGRYSQALADADLAARLDPANAAAADHLAWLLATTPTAPWRDAALARARLQAGGSRPEDASASRSEALAAASAEAGDFDAAVAWQARAVSLRPDDPETRTRLDTYRLRRPARSNPAGADETADRDALDAVFRRFGVPRFGPAPAAPDVFLAELTRVNDQLPSRLRERGAPPVRAAAAAPDDMGLVGEPGAVRPASERRPDR